MIERKPKIYVDMDGVLADFDRHHHAVFGWRPERGVGNQTYRDVDWRAVRQRKNFYLDIPPMWDAPVLWDYVKRYEPTILTGVPVSVPESPDNKRAWVRLQKFLGRDVPVICCESARKSEFCDPGAILIDDWPKYQNRWEAAGGRWITHTSASQTIEQLQELGL